MPQYVQFATVLGSHQLLFESKHPVPSPTSGAFAAQSALWVELNHLKLVTTKVGSGHGGVDVLDVEELETVVVGDVAEVVVTDFDVVDLVVVLVLDVLMLEPVIEVFVELEIEEVEVLAEEVDLVDVLEDLVELDEEEAVQETS